MKDKIKSLVVDNPKILITQIFEKRQVKLIVDEDEHPELARLARNIDKDILMNLLITANEERGNI